MNSRISELKIEIEEEYLDLEHEELPKFTLNNIESYRKSLKDLLAEIYSRLPFDVVAISCYSSFNYINTIEVANIIKQDINPNSTIAVGGIHPTVLPNDFQPGKFPPYIYQDYPNLKTTSPFDYIIKDEGELSFFNLIKGLIDGKYEVSKGRNKECIVLDSDIILDVDTLPLIDLKLLKKYRKKYGDMDILWIDFGRGCPYRCNFCLNSENHVLGYKNVRVKSVKKCIEELKILRDTTWLNLKHVSLTDLIFFPKRSAKEQFFKAYQELIEKEGELPFNLFVMERIDTCSLEDLEKYNRLKMALDIGLETCSKTLLYSLRKVLGANDSQIKINASNYLSKTEKIIEKVNQLNIHVIFNFMIGLPGTCDKTIKENTEFFFGKRFNGKSLTEKYRIKFQINKYISYSGTKTHNKANFYGIKINYKEWWKIFDEEQAYFAACIDPSPTLPFEEAYAKELKFIKRFFKTQLGRAKKSFPLLLKYLKGKEKHSFYLSRMVKRRLEKEDLVSS